VDSLKDLYIDQLQDLWSANQQAGKILEKLCDAASNEKLCEKLQKGKSAIREHNERLATIIRSYDASPDEEHCKGMEGLVKEAKKHALEADISDNAVRDAQIIAQYQRISHYGIAAYGTCRSLAQQLGCEEEAQTLSDDLENVKKGDAIMTDIAEETVNQQAA